MLIEIDFNKHMMTTSRIWVWMFGLGLSFSTATQLRIVQGIVGPGEALLLGALIYGVVIMFAQPRVGISTELFPLLLFWVLSFVLLIAGFILATNVSKQGFNAAHDILSYIFIVALLFVFILQTDEVSARRIVVIAAGSGVLILFAIYIVAQFYLSAAGIDFWLDSRFKGWARNPNQLGLYFSSLPFLLLYLIQQANSVYRKMCYIGILALSIMLGYATKSDALYLSWIVGFAILAMLYVVGKIRQPVANRLTLLLKVLIAVVILLVIIVTSAFLYEDIYQTILVMYDSHDNQGSVRLEIWKNALEAIMGSPFVGWGPGAHSGIHFPHGDFEAHNSLLDWGTSTGLIGVFTLLLLIIWIISLIVKRGSSILLASFTALIIVSLFHHYLRNPIFWVYLVLPLILAKDPITKVKYYINLGKQ